VEQARNGIEKVVAASLRQSSPGTGPVLAWPVACGHAVAARTTALDFVDGVLRVEVPDIGWKAELQSLAAQYVAVINRYTREKVRRVEFLIAAKKPAAACKSSAPVRRDA